MLKSVGFGKLNKLVPYPMYSFSDTNHDGTNKAEASLGGVSRDPDCVIL